MHSKVNRIISFLMLFLFITMLTGCNKEPDVEVLPEKPLDDSTSSQFIVYDKAKFFYLNNLKIPSNWHREDKDDGFVLTESKTGSDIVFRISDYSPIINNITKTEAASVLNTETSKFLSFEKKTGNTLSMTYYNNINGKQFLVSETQIFNFKYIYKIIFTCEEKYFEKQKDVYNTLVSSLSLSSDILGIPNGYSGIYSSSTSTFSLYPLDWQLNRGADYYTSTINNTSITVTLAQPIDNFAGMDKTTYNTVMQKTVANFSTSAFNNSNGIVIAEGYYTQDSVRYLVCNKIYNVQTHSINVIFVSPENEFASYIDKYDIISNNVFLQ